MRRIWISVLSIATLVVAIDQLTKSWAESALDDKVITMFGDLQLALTYNRGVAFGLGAGAAPLLVGLAGVGLLVAIMGRHVRINAVSGVGVGLIVGGAIGNLSDRLFRGHGGAVVDFIDLYWWPVFNVADIGVVLGAALFVIASSRKPEEES